MRIIITAEEAVDKRIWQEVAEIAGYDYYSLANGMDMDTEIQLTEEQAKKLGLI
jgi:hypothetical protein